MRGSPLHPFVFKLGRIGDMVMLTAALRLLHARYGKPCYLAAADFWAPEVYLGLPEVAECWPLPRQAPFLLGSAWPAILRALRGTAPGPVYVFEHHRRQVPRIRRLLWLSGIDPQRVINIDTQPGMELLWLDCLMQFARRTPSAFAESDYPVPPGSFDGVPHLCVLPSERDERNEWLRRRGWRGEPLILVQPGNHRTMGRRRISHWRDRDDKIWPASRWAELLRRINSEMPDAMILLRGAAAEVSLLEHIRREAALPRVVVAETPLRLLFALCECAHSMISVDTGPAHAAAALGLP
ncbi:MAG TPA: glycosyltransferase family 9 protein, partial [Steroidobacteraceae bacterium]|nr:glycosyltransferase family 9 protein [Steroidobacteraceae bacterium]